MMTTDDEDDEDEEGEQGGNLCQQDVLMAGTK